MRHKFYLPLGIVSLAAPPATPEQGDTYYDNLLKKVRTWDGTKWATGGGTLTAGAGLEGTGTSMAEDITLNVKPGPGIKIANDLVSLDVAVTGGIYVSKTGDTMVGALNLPTDDPVFPTHAAHKSYVDAGDDAILTHTVAAGNGLIGGGLLETNPILEVGAGTGIVVGANSVGVSTTWADGRYALKSHSHAYASASHTHPGKQVGVSGTTPLTAWSVPGNGQLTGLSVAHGWTGSGNPSSIVITPYADTGDMSVVASIESWDGTTLRFQLRNLDNDAETVRICIVCVGPPKL